MAGCPSGQGGRLKFCCTFVRVGSNPTPATVITSKKIKKL